jgi:hypothetical protein
VDPVKATSGSQRTPDRALPWGRTYWSDLLAQSYAHGLSACERGVLFTLLGTQQVRGSIPADVRDLLRLVGDDVTTPQLRLVLDLFFPICGDGQRRNAQHAEAWEADRRAYEGKVRGGQRRAAQDDAQDARVRGGRARAAQVWGELSER